MSTTEFCCPCCNGKLTNSLPITCCNCQSIFDMKNDIIDFRCARKDYYFSPIPRTKMLKLLDWMTTDPWESIIRSLSESGNQNSDWLYNLIAGGRYAWKILLNLEPDAVVLDFGCGLGTLSDQIVPLVAKIYVMDFTWEHLELVHKRFIRFNRNNKITLIAGGDGRYLPFPDNSIDCVLLSGMLEQFPHKMQLKFLKEIHRILKPDGQVFSEAPNRMNYEYFTKYLDRYTIFKYMRSLLPRFFSNMSSVILKKRLYRTYTYSMFGYNRLFRKANFKNVDFFSLCSENGRLKKIFPVSANVPYWLHPSPSRVKEKVKQNKYLVPLYGIIGHSSKGSHRSILDRCLGQIAQDLSERFNNGIITITDYIVTAKDKGVITGIINDQEIIIKLPFSQQALREEQQNAYFLQRAHHCITTDLPFWPESYSSGELHGLHYFVEERVIGELLKNILIKKGRTKYLHIVEEILEKMNPILSKKTKRYLTNSFYDKEINQRLEKLFYFIPDKRVRDKLSQYFYDLLYGMEVWMGFIHGDFSISNIICKHNNECKVIDWAGFLSSEIVILDVLYYLNSVHRGFTPGSTLLQSIKLLASNQWPVPEEEDFFLRQCKRCGIEKSERKALGYLYWLRHLTTGIPDYLFYGQFGVNLKIQEFVDDLSAAH